MSDENQIEEPEEECGDAQEVAFPEATLSGEQVVAINAEKVVIAGDNSTVSANTTEKYVEQTTFIVTHDYLNHRQALALTLFLGIVLALMILPRFI
jgi:hypothetical protein